MWGVCVSLATFLTGCFTGIESTKKIELSRGDMKMTAPSPEKLYLDSILAAPLGQWDIGNASSPPTTVLPSCSCRARCRMIR